MRIEPTTFLVLLSVSSFATASLRGSSRTSRIRGAVKYDNIDNKNQEANSNGRFLQATLGEAQAKAFDDEDPNHKIPTVPESEIQDNDAVMIGPRKRQGPSAGKLRSRKEKKVRDAADKVYPTPPPDKSPKEEDDTGETPEKEDKDIDEETTAENKPAKEDSPQKEDKDTDEETTDEIKPPKEDAPEKEDKDIDEETPEEIKPPKEEAPQKEDKDPDEILDDLKTPKEEAPQKEEKDPEEEKSKKEKDEDKDEKLENAAIIAPVPKPTPSPTWTFEVSSPKTAKDAAFECDYCRKEGCSFVGYNTDVVFSQGSTASCSEVRNRAKSLKPHQCDIERTTIEDACCICKLSPESSDEEVSTPQISGRMVDSSLSSSDPCEFCFGQEFIDGPIITFASENDRVSCGGFMSLVRSGLSRMDPNFCVREKDNIEDACCRPISESEEGEEPAIEMPLVVPSFSESEDEEEPAIEIPVVVPPPVVSTPTVVAQPPVDGSLEDQVEKGAEPSSPAVALVSSQTTTATSRLERDRSGCDFCNFEEEFLDGPTIFFSSGNDRVSCGGLVDLIRSGLSPAFCQSERQYIEDACCRQMVDTESPTNPPTNPPTVRPTRPPTNMPTTLPPTISPSNSPTDSPTNSKTNSPTNSPQELPVPVIDVAAVSVSLTPPPTIPEEAFDFDFDDDDFFSGNATGNTTEGEEGQVASTADEDILEIFLEQNNGDDALVNTNQELSSGEAQAEEPQVEDGGKKTATQEAPSSESEKKGPGKQGKPSTIAGGGKRENGPMANVDHKRERPKKADDASAEPGKRLGQSAMGGAVDSRQVGPVEEEPSSRKNEPATGGDVDSGEIDPFEQEPGSSSSSSRLGQSSMGVDVDSREVDPVSDPKKTGLVKKTTAIEPPFNGANTRSWGARRFMGIYRGMGGN